MDGGSDILERFENAVKTKIQGGFNSKYDTFIVRGRESEIIYFGIATQKLLFVADST